MKYLSKNKKGVSPIIATLLLIVIAVAAAVVTYAFVTGFIGGATGGAGGGQGSMSMDSYIVYDSNSAGLYMRNTGTKTLTLQACYVAGVNASMNGAQPGLPVGGGAVLVIVNSTGAWSGGASVTVRFVAVDGTPFEAAIHK